ncbi:hypothetical protein KKD62_00790 [Patescibacteria group bacterium]|nr:hypothetical protein [Patescibacteria group bacterium]
MKQAYLILLVIFLFALIFHLLPIFYSDISFNYDTAASWLEVRDMVMLTKPRLVGGEGGIKGIFFGPTWHYILAGLFFVFNGDPRAGALASALINLSCIPLAWLIGKQINQLTGILAAFFFALAPIMIGSSSYQFVVNAFPFINLMALWLLNYQNKKWTLMALAFWASLSFHFEPVVAIGFNLAIFGLMFKSIKKLAWKNKLSLVLIWLLPFGPQLIFDLRHDWLQTRAIIKFIQERGQGLGGSLPFFTRLINRPYLLINHFSETVTANHIWLSTLLLGLMIFGLKAIFIKGSLKQKQLAKQSLTLLSIPLLYYIFIFSPGIKPWYYTSFPAVYGIVFALTLTWWLKQKNLKYFAWLALSGFCLTGIWASAYLPKLKQGFPSTDPSSLKNQLAVIDWIYQDSAGQDFVVYTYSPAIYDYPWQYLFWWQAEKKQLPLPKDFSYQPKTYDYVANKLAYVPPPETSSRFITYLIFEPHDPSRETSYTPEDFMQPYVDLQLIASKNFNSRIRVEKRL